MVDEYKNRAAFPKTAKGASHEIALVSLPDNTSCFAQSICCRWRRVRPDRIYDPLTVPDLK